MPSEDLLDSLVLEGWRVSFEFALDVVIAVLTSVADPQVRKIGVGPDCTAALIAVASGRAGKPASAP